jgi:2-keto-4-pentenoate hydratase/2-oxohepta-3-ene-1,7-dioic acid hydratase in catechol pathway
MKLYLGLLESSPPLQTRVFGAVEGKLVDLSLTYAARLNKLLEDQQEAYELAARYFPPTISAFLDHGESALEKLSDLVAFVDREGVANLRGPSGEKLVYNFAEVRLLPPFPNPEKSFVIGFSDRARIEALPKAEIPTGFYKLPQNFVTSGAPIIWPNFSTDVDADACVAVVIGKAGRRIQPDRAWDYVAGVTLLIDITARDVNRREGLTTNNLLGKNFPSSTCLGPAMLPASSRKEIENLEIDLALDGVIKQKFILNQCVFSIENIIAHWSILGIKPGDLLAIGASIALQGDRLQSPVPLKLGCKIRCSSPAIGELSHHVVSSGGLRR